MQAVHPKAVPMTAEHTMAEGENIVGELHGHFDQALRTALSGGLQITEQRARRRQNEAEAERLLAAEATRQLEERKRAEVQANALLVQQRIALEEAERAEQTRRTADEAAEKAMETPGENATEDAPTAYPTPIGEALARSHQSTAERSSAEHTGAEHTAKTRHQRERGSARTTPDLGR
jgi:membrane protein involved in colicin uptake